MSKASVFGWSMVILLIATSLRVINLHQNPGWYTDQGTHIVIAQQLIDGENQYLGIGNSYLIAARLPLFEHLLAGWFRLVGDGMLQLRLLTVLLGILTVVGMFRTGMILFSNQRIALGAMALFSVFPQAVIYSRFGFSYNLLALCIVSSLYYCLRFSKSNRPFHLYISCALLGFGTITDFIVWSFVPPFVLIILLAHRKYIIPSIICIALPFFAYAMIELMTHPAIFLHDLSYTLARAGGLPIHRQIDNLGQNISVLSQSSWWFPVGFIGLFTIDRNIRWKILLLVIIPFLISGRTVALYNLSAYYMIPFLPFIALGVTGLVYRLSAVFPVKYRRLCLSIIMIGLTSVVSPSLLQHTINGYSIGIEHFLIDGTDARDIQTYLFDYTNSDTVIITSPTLAWMFDSQVTDFQISSLASGSSIHFPATLYPDRLTFDVHYENADYAIVDNLWRDWGAVHMPIVRDMLDTVTDTWTLIYTKETIQIYQNPQA